MSSTLELASGVTQLCQHAFDPQTIQNGLACRDQQRVLTSNALLHKDRVDVRATVQGSHHKPYLVEAKIVRKRQGVRIESICTCAVGFNCKHAVAAIAEALVREGSTLFNLEDARLVPVERETVVELEPEPLARHYLSWFSALRTPAAALPAPEKAVVYRLNFNSHRGFEVQIMHSTKLKAGELGKPVVWRSQQLDDHSPYPPEDLAILRELAGSLYRADTYPLRGAFGAQMLRRLLATGRCHFKNVRHDAPLREGPIRSAKLDWTLLPDGRQSPTLAVEPAAHFFVPLDPPAYIDTAAGECGNVESAHSPAVIRNWLSAPPVEALQSHVVATLVRGMGLPAPREIAVVERRNVRPTPVLKLMHVKLERPFYRWNRIGGSGTEEELDIARLEFDYAGHRVGYFHDDVEIEAFQESRVERVTRDYRREEKACDALTDAGLLGMTEVCGYDVPDEITDDFALSSPKEWMSFMSEGVPALRKKGWIVEVDPAFRYQFAAVEDWYSDAAGEAGGNDWFSIELGILVEGERVNLLPLIRTALEQIQQLDPKKLAGEFVVVTLPDGRHVQLPAERIFDIGKTIAELYDPAAIAGGRLKVSRLRAAELIDIPGTGQWKCAGELRELARRIRAYKGITTTAPPAGLNATLRPYQLDGLAWLQFLREYSFGGILADDMGLGKTVQLLAHLLLEKESGRANLPSLVVAPTSLMANWRAETERFAPALRIHVSHGGERKEHFEKLADYDLIVTSYSLLPRDEEILKKQPFHLLVLDEAQYVKNPNTKWADVARSLSSRHRLCMTGTPMENHLGELWSLMTFLSPGYLGTQQQFSRVYRGPIEKRNDHDRRTSLAARMKPFILRRRKEEVALDLPPKTEILRTVELDGAQRDLYETIRIAMHERVRAEVERKGMDRSHIIILDALLKLRQVCCDPRLVKLDRARRVKESAKLEMLLEMLSSMRDEGRRILLFSQFTSMLDLIEPEIKKLAIPFVRLDGSTADRATPVKRFQAGEIPLFLISLKAGGTGLNLTAADTVIHYDPWWNPAVERQATDRAHRIGQTKKVFVYKLVTTGTVEEKILAMQERKKELVAGLLGEGAQENLQLSKEDLDHLFDPIA